MHKCGLLLLTPARNKDRGIPGIWHSIAGTSADGSGGVTSAHIGIDRLKHVHTEAVEPMHQVGRIQPNNSGKAGCRIPESARKGSYRVCVNLPSSLNQGSLTLCVLPNQSGLPEHLCLF